MTSTSYTVENYLKAIYQAQAASADPEASVPMGRLASALGVVPGTATTMMKALSEAGLVEYEPYVGVRLTGAGEKLAAMVLRRHRLIELFLVQVMGMSWAEVHDEAEHLEHAVSDRLIDRIDDMLGRPTADPHGDPIPDDQGQLALPQHDTLLTCPLDVPVKVTRVTDQDADFLRFIENSRLMPGETVEIQERDTAADRVRLKRRADLITIGTRAAAKVMVQVIALLLVALTPFAHARQQPAPTPDSSRPFEILDNSFLVEEAFNQEAGIYQNIVGFVRGSDGWELAFTQEWPVISQSHQLSYTLPFEGIDGTGNGFGDAMLNYRLQVLTETARQPAFAPRVSLIFPTGGTRDGADTTGYQVNLPFSKQAGDLYFHWNGGFTAQPGVHLPERGEHVTLFTPHASLGTIWRARPLFHVMLEAVFESEESIAGTSATERTRLLTLSPGFRVARNLHDRQLVLGAALPVTFRNGGSNGGVFLYFSYELPWR
ncbi:MAG TPA: metal-dependent transcriptional regulator [Vicinamibacterales bacterium]|nr:metal-dependent transcriptional regulator [Vicinamibacterales bacterium]